MSAPAPPGRLRALAADAGVRATAATRLIALAGAPVSIYLAATRLEPRVQGYYFVAVNLIALAQLFEIGLGTIVVQFASHEWPALRWGARGGLEGNAGSVAAARALLRVALRWYGLAALGLFVLASVGGVAFFASAYAASAASFAVRWGGFVALTAAYLLVVPFTTLAEGCGDLLSVQRMRSWQAATLLVALWTGILASSPFAAASLGAAAQLVAALAWLLARHPALLRWARATAADPAGEAMGAAAHAPSSPPGSVLTARFRVEQRRSAALWIALWAAPQLLTPIALALHGGDDAGRLGVTLAIALAPLTLALAWLHGRYPSFGALVSEGRRAEFDALARGATVQAVGVFAAAAAGVTAIVALLPRLLPGVAARVLPLPVLMALFVGALSSLVIQAMAGWLRAFRDERLAVPVVWGSTLVLAMSIAGGVVGSVQAMAFTYAGGSVLLALPIAAAHFLRVRRERML